MSNEGAETTADGSPVSDGDTDGTQADEEIDRFWRSINGLRGRRLLDRYAWVGLVVAAVLLVAGAGIIYTVHINPGVETEPQVQLEWQETGEFSHGATVINESGVFDVGETLHDRQTYYTRISPTLTGTYSYGYTANSGELEPTMTLTLILRSVSDGEILWEQTEELNNQTVTELQPGETATISFDVDVPEIERRLAAIEETLGSSTGQTEILIESSVVATGSIEDEPANVDHTNTLAVSPGGSTYSVDLDGAYSQSHERVTQEPAEPSYGPLYSALGPLLFILGGLIGGGIGGLRYRGALSLSATEQQRLTHHRTRSELDDWITTGVGRSPIEIECWIQIDSLEGLVDVAIDTNSRVIEDRTGSVYYVINGGQTYTYTPNTDRDPGELLGRRGGGEPSSKQFEGANSEGIQTTNGTTQPPLHNGGEAGEGEKREGGSIPDEEQSRDEIDRTRIEVDD